MAAVKTRCLQLSYIIISEERARRDPSTPRWELPAWPTRNAPREETASTMAYKAKTICIWSVVIYVLIYSAFLL